MKIFSNLSFKYKEKRVSKGRPPFGGVWGEAPKICYKRAAIDLKTDNTRSTDGRRTGMVTYEVVPVSP